MEKAPLPQVLTPERVRGNDIESVLTDIKEHALPFEEVRGIEEKIATLQTTEGDYGHDIAELQAVLDKSTITVKTLTAFKALMEKVALNEEHLKNIIGMGTEHALQAQRSGIHSEGYSLLVAKEGEDFRYKAWEVFSQQTVESEIKALPGTYQPSQEDIEKIEVLRRELLTSPENKVE
ncbi:MAG: hypothetical protein ABIO57_01430 [Candidatus Paceibacterota bacterium]